MIIKPKLLLLSLACYSGLAAAQCCDYWMNIYAQDDCNDYKSTQDLDPSGGAGCVNIDWAESFAVDVTDDSDDLTCSTTLYGNENCQTELAILESQGNSGCKEYSEVVKSISFECVQEE